MLLLLDLSAVTNTDASTGQPPFPESAGDGESVALEVSPAAGAVGVTVGTVT